MAGPTLGEYQEALQNPSTAFDDPVLRACRPLTDALGFPRVIAGNFAVVFPVDSPTGKIAIRCFSTHHSDLEERYAAVTHALSASKLDCTVGFRFLKKGIRVRQAWHPVLVMEWVDGPTLNEYVEQNLANPGAFRQLAENFAKAVTALSRCTIAHGDLQHGNVVIAGGDVRLIDYDCMFVKGLEGRISHELGQRNYQHPRRQATDFGPHVDNFSAWVIYVTLLALASDPGLWREFGGGDERLLLSREDFDSPANSRVFNRLVSLSDHRVSDLAKRLRDFTQQDLRAIPGIEAATGPAVSRDSVVTCDKCGTRNRLVKATRDAAGQWKCAACKTIIATTANPSTLPLWLDEQFPAENATPVPGVSAAAVEADPARSGRPDWLDDVAPTSTGVLQQQATLPVLDFGNDLATDRRVVSVTGVGIGFALASWAGGLLSAASAGAATAGACALCVWQVYMRYKALPLWQSAQGVRVAAEQAAEEVRRLDTLLQNLTSLRSRTIASFNERLADADRSIAAVGTRQQGTLSALDVELKQKRDSLVASRAKLDQEQRQEAARLLEQIQEQATSADLASKRIASAKLQGIGEKAAQSLAAEGIRTAADFVDVRDQKIRRAGFENTMTLFIRPGGAEVHVEGIGPAKGAQLRSWRASLQAKAKGRAPTTLSASTVATLSAKFEARLKDLEREVLMLEASLPQRRKSACDKVATEVARLQSDKVTLKAARAAEDARLNSEAQWLAAKIAQQQAERDRLRLESESYNSVNFGSYVRAVAGRVTLGHSSAAP